MRISDWSSDVCSSDLRVHVPSLQGFLHWLAAGAVEIKRDLDAGARGEVRIMTVHGAKGLQAPIVFLPDTLQVPQPRGGLLWRRTTVGGETVGGDRKSTRLNSSH